MIEPRSTYGSRKGESQSKAKKTRKLEITNCLPRKRWQRSVDSTGFVFWKPNSLMENFLLNPDFVLGDPKK